MTIHPKRSPILGANKQQAKVSNYLSIATVTASIGRLSHIAAQSAVAGAGLRYGRPGAAEASALVNVCLYQMTPNTVRTRDVPGFGSDGRRSGGQPLWLDLFYLLTFYGDAELFEPELIAGAVVRDLQARPVLDATSLSEGIAAVSELAASDLAASIQIVSMVPTALSIDDLSRLWSAMFMAPYSLSAGYHVSIVIDTPAVEQMLLPVRER